MNLYDGMSVQDALALMTGNLVSMKKNDLFAKRLFGEKEGSWVEVEKLCEGISDVESQLQELSDYDYEINLLLVGWLTFSARYNIVIFVAREVLWSNVVLRKKEYHF